MLNLWKGGNVDNEFILQDRLQKIRQIINKYGEENFYIAFSGGKDSTVLHYLMDQAIPGNKIPRLYSDTGIELNIVKHFVADLAESDDRIIMIKPTVPIKPMLEQDGYPFKSKFHSKIVSCYKRNGEMKTVRIYTGKELPSTGKVFTEHQCPKKLLYQFTPEFSMNISPKCCDRLKKEPMHNWAKANNKMYYINGIMADEGGQRMTAKCLAFNGKKLKAFQPLAPLTKEWEDWFIKTYNIKICDIYYEPYNFDRTGCKGCPFALNLQEELEILEHFFPAERKQCEFIWKPVYDEYRRIGYRLKDKGV